MTAWELMDGLGEVEEEMLWPALNIKTHRSYRRALRIALVAAAVLVLASPGARGFQGARLLMDGGSCAQLYPVDCEDDTSTMRER